MRAIDDSLLSSVSVIAKNTRRLRMNYIYDRIDWTFIPHDEDRIYEVMTDEGFVLSVSY